jgi:hypothetical protein
MSNSVLFILEEPAAWSARTKPHYSLICIPTLKWTTDTFTLKQSLCICTEGRRAGEGEDQRNFPLGRENMG